MKLSIFQDNCTQILFLTQKVCYFSHQSLRQFARRLAPSQRPVSAGNYALSSIYTTSTAKGNCPAVRETLYSITIMLKVMPNYDYAQGDAPTMITMLKVIPNYDDSG